VVLFRQTGGPFIGGRGSTGRGDLRRERGWCRLTKGRGGRGFRRGAAACCGVLLAHSQAAGWSGAEGASDGCGEGVRGVLLLFIPCLTAWVGAGEAGVDRGSVHGMATGPGRT
jgi:hypothetical protein